MHAHACMSRMHTETHTHTHTHTHTLERINTLVHIGERGRERMRG